LVFFLTSIGFALLPGPNVVFLLARTMASGPWPAWRSALGVESATMTFAVLTAAGVAGVISASATAFAVLRWAGIAYLCWLGIRALTGGASTGPDENPEAAEADVRDLRRRQAKQRLRDFRQGFLVGISNPKVVVFFLAFLPQFVTGGSRVELQLLALGVTFALCGLACDAMFCVVFGFAGRRLRGNRAARRYVGRATAGVYFGLAGWAALSGGHRRT
jgi:threonine/homoserine/homoserine lactone efflux protein